MEIRPLAIAFRIVFIECYSSVLDIALLDAFKLSLNSLFKKFEQMYKTRKSPL